MDNAINKDSYVRTLTEAEYLAVESGNTKKIWEIIGGQRSFMLGDSMVAFNEKPIKHGLYKVEWGKGKVVYYVVQTVVFDDRAFCYSIY